MLRGQAAMEYLVTYGWAVLGVVILLGSLSYFGIFRPEDSLPERCYLPSEIACEDFQIINNGVTEEVTILVRNLNRQDLFINSVNCTLSEPHWQTHPPALPGISDSKIYEETGETYAVLRTNTPTNITCGGAFSGSGVVKGKKKKVKIEIEVFTDPNFKKLLKGEVFGKVR